jgi:antirestriction protein ArdC
MTTTQPKSAATRDPDNTPRGAGTSQRVTAQIIEMLRHGVRPWVAPWDAATALGLPLRANGMAYRGVNVVALWAAAQARGYRARHWLSFKQALALGGAVRRGERGQHVIFYSSGTSAEEGDAEPAQRPRRAVLRSYAVFNADQVGGLPVHFYAPPVAPPTADETALAACFARVPATIQHGGARACYNPTTDAIHLPPRHSFASTAQYFATLLHELAHWTGAPTRLARDLQPRSSIAAYAREELTAELTAAFLGAELNLPVDHLEDHAAYIDVWLKLIDREPNALLTAAGRAQAAADLIRGYMLPEAEA